MATLIFVHDPMCSWCWAFRPVWQRLRAALPPDLPVKSLLGGLAPDSDEPMPEALREMISGAWHTIEKRVPGTRFNYEFWQQCNPRRSTYPACRAVIAARHQDAEAAMIEALQHAYYLRAMNTSDTSTHKQLAEELGLDIRRFEADLLDPATHQALLHEIAAARSIGGDSFPSLFVESGGAIRPIALDYLDEKRMLQQIECAV